MRGERFAPCPEKPNCVSSKDTRDGHQIEPLTYQDDLAAARNRLIGVLGGIPRVSVVEFEERYIHATFTSLLFRFIDDMEFQFDDSRKLIHIRSASRVGYSDLGANRRRCESIRERFDSSRAGFE